MEGLILALPLAHLGGLLRTRAHEEGDEGAPALAQHLDLAQLAVAVELVAQVRLGDLRREAAHPQRGDALVLGRRELGLLPGPVQVLLGEQILLGAVVPVADGLVAAAALRVLEQVAQLLVRVRVGLGLG